MKVLCSEEHQLARAELHSQLQVEVERREGLEAEVSGNKEELRHLRWPQSSTELQTELHLCREELSRCRAQHLAQVAAKEEQVRILEQEASMRARLGAARGPDIQAVDTRCEGGLFFIASLYS